MLHHRELHVLVYNFLYSYRHTYISVGSYLNLYSVMRDSKHRRGFVGTIWIHSWFCIQKAFKTWPDENIYHKSACIKFSLLSLLDRIHSWSYWKQEKIYIFYFCFNLLLESVKESCLTININIRTSMSMCHDSSVSIKIETMINIDWYNCFFDELKVYGNRTMNFPHKNRCWWRFYLKRYFRRWIPWASMMFKIFRGFYTFR